MDHPQKGFATVSMRIEGTGESVVRWPVHMNQGISIARKPDEACNPIHLPERIHPLLPAALQCWDSWHKARSEQIQPAEYSAGH